MGARPILSGSQHEDGRRSAGDETMPVTHTAVQSAHSVDPDPASDDLAADLAALAGARPGDHLVIAGGGIDLAIDLLHQGFAHVACAKAGHALTGEDPDVLLIPEPGSAEDLARILGCLGRRMPASGVAVIYDRRLPTRRRRAALEDVLARHGFGRPVRRRCASGYALKVEKCALDANLVAAA